MGVLDFHAFPLPPMYLTVGGLQCSLNLEATVLGILERVGFIEVAKVPKSLPWKHIPVGTRRRVG